MFRPLLVAAATTAALAAQGTAFVPNQNLVRFAADGVPALLAMLPKTGPGKLLAEPGVAETFQKGLQRYRALTARNDGLKAFARSHELELDEWLRRNLGEVDAFRAVRELDLADMQRIDITAVLGGEGDRSPRTVATIACSPRAEGRWTQVYERYVKSIADSKVWKADPDAKFEGTPYHLFAPANADESEVQQFGGADPRIWLLHLP
ncbi:MAG: hypothetical protein JNK15_02685, partial [Planctomycetes bacterium]|nr:hypothetical protein [Planctomycetota bacterium]